MVQRIRRLRKEVSGIQTHRVACEGGWGGPRVDRVLEGSSSAGLAGLVPFKAGSGAVPLRFWCPRMRFVSFRLCTTARARAPMV